MLTMLKITCLLFLIGQIISGLMFFVLRRRKYDCISIEVIEELRWLPILRYVLFYAILRDRESKIQFFITYDTDGEKVFNVIKED